MVEPFVALVAEVRPAEEPCEGIATVVVVVFLDETNDLVGGYGSSVVVVSADLDGNQSEGSILSRDRR